MRTIILAILVVLLLAYTDTAHSLSHDWRAGEARCHHSPEKLTTGVHIPSASGDGGARKKRDVGFKPLRMFIHYDDSVNTELDNFQRSRLQNIVIPAAENLFESALSVLPLSDPILLDRDCSDGVFVIPVGEVRECFNECSPQTTCGPIVVPEDHLKRCVECGGSFATCATRPGSVDGSGIADADIVIYVGTSLAGGTCSPTSNVIAFASACQLENTLDRPIAGYINFCPDIFAAQTDAQNIEVALHELTHVLVFSPGLYPFFRDENGLPRTPRDQFGRPEDPVLGLFQPSSSTVTNITYTDWLTRNGEITRDVDAIVTPNVIEQAKIHFGCNDIIGVELENQGGQGTAFAHWEHRVVGNEAMTGVLLFNGPFSRITFGLFEDSGWYIPNYELAQELAWGRNRGCSIPHGSCAEHIQNQQASQRTLSPFCNVLQDVGPPVRTCSVDRDLFSECSLIEFSPGQVPPEFQYFNSGANFGSDVAPNVGSSFIFMDYCPFESPFSIDIPTSSCSNLLDAPGDNIAGETYGTGSRCIEHGQTWTRTLAGGQVDTYNIGVGCYQYSCSQLGVEIHLLGLRYLCFCEGEELLIDNTIDGIRYEGSFICPSCLSLCFDDLVNCTNPEPDACPGQQTIAEPLTSSTVLCFQEYNSGSCSTLLGPSSSSLECCGSDGGSAYQTSLGECIQCPDQSTTPGPVAPVTPGPVAPVTPDPVSPETPGPVAPVTPGPVAPGSDPRSGGGFCAMRRLKRLKREDL